MTFSTPTRSSQNSVARTAIGAARVIVGSRVGLFALAALALGLGLTFNWSWLFAVGIAPILMSLLPCAAMCALGLRMTGRSTGKQQPPGSATSGSDLPTPLRLAASTDATEELTALVATISPPRSPLSGSMAYAAIGAARVIVGSRVGLLALAAGALGLGLTFNWSWLVAAGIAPVILSILPCAAMCALGLCMTCMVGRPGKQASPADGAVSQPDFGPTQTLRLTSSPDGSEGRIVAADLPAGAVENANANSCCNPRSGRISHA